MEKVFLNFDFYGSGNLGDDLMLDGFLAGLKESDAEYYCAVPGNSAHQKFRFKKVKFFDYNLRSEISEKCSCFAGVGDTPIQIKSGDWFIGKLLKDSELKKKNNFRYFFIGIGAEKESIEKKEIFKSILSEVDHIWTRDKSTAEFLVNALSVNNNKVTISSDLANISLKRLFDKTVEISERKYDFGVCYYDEKPEKQDIINIGKYLKSIKPNKCLLFGNEVKKAGLFEYNIYKKIIGRNIFFFNKHIEIFFPDYYGETSLAKLTEHFGQCKTVVTSRYHALLTAAWAGCRVISLERSSKVSALAEELGIYEIKKPFTEKKLREEIMRAVTVSRKILNELHSKALSSVNEFEKIIFSSMKN